MASVSCTFSPQSWVFSLAGGFILLFLGLLLFIEPGVSLRLALYSLGALALVIAVIFLVVAATLSRGGGWPFLLPLGIGILMLLVAFAAFAWPGLLGGILATIAGAVFVVGGLGIAISGFFSLEPPGRRALLVLAGAGLLATGLLVIFRSEMTAILITRVVGVFLICPGTFLLARALHAWWRERHTLPTDGLIVRR